MTEPAWGGRGRDPWLPSRLDARIEAGTAERVLRRAVWAALSGWLAQVSRRVLRGDRPDPDEIMAMGPAWARRVDEITTDTVRPMLGQAYESLMGSGYRWEQRPAVSAHLAEVSNRMVRVPDEVFDLVSGQVSQAVNLGESIPDISDRIAQTLDSTATPRWSNRATVTARTETIGALNSGRSDAFRALAGETGRGFEKVWISTVDDRTRETHVDADGQRVPVDQPFVVGGFELDYPGDPDGPAEEVIQCRCTMLLVEPGEDTDLSNRQFLDR
jgi:uncharacterized protein with gpF-like domain